MSTLLQVPTEKPAARRRIRRSKILGTLGLACGSISLIVAVIHSLWGPFSPQPSFAQRVIGVVEAMSNSLVPDTVGHTISEQRVAKAVDADLTIQRVVVLFSVVGMLIAILAYAGGESIRVVGGALLLNGIAFGLYHVFVTVILLALLAVGLVALGASVN